MRSSQPRCYFCEHAADGPADHVPPEALFRGVGGRSYKSPEIITVPSCREHNEGASADDEVLAWVMSDASSGKSSVGFDVFQALMAHVSERTHKDRNFADQRLQNIGMRLLRDSKDFDQNGSPKTPIYDAEYILRTEQTLRDRWVILERSLKKIAAGLFFHATNGNSLGINAAHRLYVVVPEFKQIGATISLTGLDSDEAAFFSKRVFWQKIVSGSPDVFQCDIAHHSGSKQFEMKMLFFESIRVWIKTRAN
jgi:hypothetical protein